MGRGREKGRGKGHRQEDWLADSVICTTCWASQACFQGRAGGIAPGWAGAVLAGPQRPPKCDLSFCPGP